VDNTWAPGTLVAGPSRGVEGREKPGSGRVDVFSYRAVGETFVHACSMKISHSLPWPGGKRRT